MTWAWRGGGVARGGRVARGTLGVACLDKRKIYCGTLANDLGFDIKSFYDFFSIEKNNLKARNRF